MYGTTDVHSKQYRYADEFWLWYVFSFTNIVIIDIWMNSPVNFRRKIDGINVSDKTYF